MAGHPKSLEALCIRCCCSIVVVVFVVKSRSLLVVTFGGIRGLRLEYEYEIEYGQYEYNFSNRERILKIIKWHSNIVPNKAFTSTGQQQGDCCGNVTSLKFESRTRTPIYSDLKLSIVSFVWLLVWDLYYKKPSNFIATFGKSLLVLCRLYGF